MKMIEQTIDLVEGLGGSYRDPGKKSMMVWCAIPEMDGRGLYLLLYNPVVMCKNNRYCGLGSLIYAAAQLEVNGSAEVLL